MSPYRLLIEVLAFAIALGGMFAMGYHGGVKAEHAVMQAQLSQMQAAWADERQALESRALQVEQARAAETGRRLDAARSQDHEDIAHAEHRADAAVAAAGAAERLRQRAEAVAATCGSSRSGDPAVASVSPAASSPGDLLTDVQRRMEEAAGSIVGFADASADAAQSCAARYDALNR